MEEAGRRQVRPQARRLSSSGLEIALRTIPMIRGRRSRYSKLTKYPPASQLGLVLPIIGESSRHFLLSEVFNTGNIWLEQCFTSWAESQQLGSIRVGCPVIPLFRYRDVTDQTGERNTTKRQPPGGARGD
jgi:hypothetical protein